MMPVTGSTLNPGADQLHLSALFALPPMVNTSKLRPARSSCIFVPLVITGPEQARLDREGQSRHACAA